MWLWAFCGQIVIREITDIFQTRNLQNRQKSKQRISFIFLWNVSLKNNKSFGLNGISMRWVFESHFLRIYLLMPRHETKYDKNDKMITQMYKQGSCNRGTTYQEHQITLWKVPVCIVLLWDIQIIRDTFGPFMPPPPPPSGPVTFIFF